MNILRKATANERLYELIEHKGNFYVCDKDNDKERVLRITPKKADRLKAVHQTNFIGRAKNFLDTAYNSGLKDINIKLRASL